MASVMIVNRGVLTSSRCTFMKVPRLKSCINYCRVLKILDIIHNEQRASINSTGCLYGSNFSNVPNIIRSKSPDVDLVDDKSLPEFLFKKFDTFGTRTAIVDGITGNKYLFSEIQEKALKLGSALTRLGFQKNDVLATYCPNVIEFPIIYLSVLSLGGVVTTLSPLATVNEISHQLKATNSKFLVTVPDLVVKAKEAANLTGLMELLVVGEAEGFLSVQELFEDDGSYYPDVIDISPKEDVAMLPFSSGTTGLPKGVMLTHFNLSANIQQGCDMPGYYEAFLDEKVLAVLPFFHIFGFNINLGASLYGGATVVTLPRFEAELFLETIQNYKVERLVLVPPLVLFLAKSPLVDKYDLSSVKSILCGAAPLSKDLQLALERRLTNIYIKQGYGLTESSPGIVMSFSGRTVHGSSGEIFPNTELKVIDLDTEEVLGANQTGEICARGPQIMKGYHNNPKATEETIDSEGWLRTGDIGYYNDDEVVFVVDRCKELIKYKGMQVAPAELEALLISHPKIEDAAVIGIADEECGELPKAYVVAKDLNEQEVLTFVEKNVAAYKKLRGGVEFVDVIPKSASGKILRRMLRDGDQTTT